MLRITGVLSASPGFRSTEALLEHRRTSALHITCGYCGIAKDFASLVELWQHCCDAHFSCPYCEGASARKTAAAFERHYRVDHFTCSLLRAHIHLEHFPCCFCNYRTVFASPEDLLDHQRTAHGCFDCRFCYPQQPRIIWPARWRKHMEQCYYPNPCTDNFDLDATVMIDVGNLCKKRFPPQTRKIH